MPCKLPIRHERRDGQCHFKECDAGWIFFSVAAGSRSVGCRGSEVFDPFPKLTAWLEAIAGGTQACAFILDEEAQEKEFKALGGEGGSLRLVIENPDTNKVLLETVVDRRQCVGEFYHTCGRSHEALAQLARQERHCAAAYAGRMSRGDYTSMPANRTVHEPRWA